MSRDYDDDRDDDLDDRGRHEGPESGVEDEATEKAMQRTNVPGVLLIVVGVLNVLWGGFECFRGVQVLTLDKGDIKGQMQKEQLTPEQKKQLEEMEKQGWSIDKVVDTMGGGCLGIGGVGILAAIITIIGGVRMRSLQGYGLAVVGSILAIIPVVSGAGCCLLGEIAGIWGLVVLLSPEVKSAFR